MFTGLIEEVGTVESLSEKSDGRILTLRAQRVTGDAKKGDSIAINGACQTVTDLGDGVFSVFVSKVTLSVTTLGSLQKGSPVNMERAMTPASRFGGHIVQGHVDGVGQVRRITRDSSGVAIEVAAGKDLMKYIVSKGSITVDGISLTVVEAFDDGFSLYLIPETIGNTIINEWKEGSDVNLEVDILAKYVEKMLRAPGNKESGDAELMKKLSEEGFLS